MSTGVLSRRAVVARGAQTRRYSVLGVPVVVTSDVPAALARVEDTYTAFRRPGHGDAASDVLRVELTRLAPGNGFSVRGGDGHAANWDRQENAIIDLLGCIVAGVMPRLHARGIHAIHAGAAVHRGRAVIVCGRSGQGKTTLVLGLLRRGLGLLSDEFAVVQPDTAQLAPYRRSLHVRRPTLELIPELAFLRTEPAHELGGGIEWALSPRELEHAIPGCLAPAAPLGHVLVLDGEPDADRVPAITPVPGAVAAMELLRGTWSASVDFGGALRRIGAVVAPARCARLRTGELDATVAAILAWMEADGE